MIRPRYKRIMEDCEVEMGLKVAAMDKAAICDV
jgi:hypothetical protein